jgi:hypothetical protein
MQPKNEHEERLMILGNNIVSEVIRTLFRGGNGTTLEDAWNYMEEEYRMEYIEELTEAVYKKLVKE